MICSPQRSHPDTVCRACYISLARECRRRGLDSSEIERSARMLSYPVGAMYYLKDVAYKPTGIALGCPLPDKQITRRLWRLSRLVDKYLVTLCCGRKPTFAFVPPDWYHVTLVNRSHFASTAITLMTEEERKVAQDVIAQVGGGPIVLHINGLVLTTGGRLIIPGFPSDDRLYELRARLVETLPQLGINVPTAAHIKLGHVLTQLNEAELGGFLTFLTLCGEHISSRLTFDNVYTLTGRIVF